MVFDELTLYVILSMSGEGVLPLAREDSQSVVVGHASVNTGCSSMTLERPFWVPHSFWLSGFGLVICELGDWLKRTGLKACTRITTFKMHFPRHRDLSEGAGSV